MIATAAHHQILGLALSLVKMLTEDRCYETDVVDGIPHFCLKPKGHIVLSFHASPILIGPREQQRAHQCPCTHTWA